MCVSTITPLKFNQQAACDQVSYKGLSGIDVCSCADIITEWKEVFICYVKDRGEYIIMVHLGECFTSS